jgi:Na+-translocating ferredoxin:NAD+ oxidoreductase subunit B
VSEAQALVQALTDALPQTQCTRCGFPDCGSYAQAIAHDGASINQCPPGGAEGIARLAALTGRPRLPLNPANGREGPRLLAVIDEDWCIGCTLCLNACPVDCIVGGPKTMHTVIAVQCTGCELCLPACPVDCIALRPLTGTLTGWDAWSDAQAREAGERFAWHRQRQERDARERTERLDANSPPQRVASP